MKYNSIIIVLVILLICGCSRSGEKISSLTQLKDKRICVLTGSAGDLAVKEAFPAAEFFDLISASDAAMSVSNGKTDAFVHNKIILSKITSKNPDLIILEEPVSEVSIAAALKKGNTELLDTINAVLKILKTDGILDAMEKKWIDTDYNQLPPGLPVLDNSGLNGVLRIGTCAKAEPLTFYFDNKLTGFDIELTMRIGALLGKTIEFTDMNFEGLVPALESDKIDIAFSNFNVTEERKKFVSFSDAYLVNDISALVKK